MGTRVVVGVSGSLRSLSALHRAVDEARSRDALLVPVLAWTPPGGESAYRHSPCPPLAREWERAARNRLENAFDEAFGGRRAGLSVRPLVVRGGAGPALVGVADEPDDLLVVSSGRRGRVRRLVGGSVSRYCLRHACCPVLTVPPSELHAMLERGVRGSDAMALLARSPGTVAGH